MFDVVVVVDAVMLKQSLKQAQLQILLDMHLISSILSLLAEVLVELEQAQAVTEEVVVVLEGIEQIIHHQLQILLKNLVEAPQ